MRRKKQLQLGFSTWQKQPKEVILNSVSRLQKMHKDGLLGGEVMPEDANPKLPFESS